MKIDLTGKTAIITGSTEGIGEACALGLAEAGASVVLNGRKADALETARAAAAGAVSVEHHHGGRGRSRHG